MGKNGPFTKNRPTGMGITTNVRRIDTDYFISTDAPLFFIQQISRLLFLFLLS